MPVRRPSGGEGDRVGGMVGCEVCNGQGGRVEVGQPLIIHAIGGQGVVGVKGPTF